MNETIATGLRQPDGPVVLPDGRVAFIETEDSCRALSLVESGGATHEICKPGGRPGGLAIDGEGCFWVAGGPQNSLVRLAPDGSLLKRIDGPEGSPFIFPKHLAFGPDGLLYMSDSGVRAVDLVDGPGVRSDFFDASYNGRIYQIDPRQGRVLRTLATGLLLANGIAFGTDGLLYYGETLTGTIHRQVVGGRPEVFAQALRSPTTDSLQGPAGMAFNAAGILYCAIYGQGDISLIDGTGKIAGRIPTNGRLPADIAFTPDGKYALIAEQEHGAIEKIPVPRPGGLPLHRPAI